jgi:serine/threonine-protein kinase
MTQTSAVIGTAQYLSPEQARGEQVDARSDVYATGCVLYELVVGQPPFVGDSPVSVAYQHVREDAKPPSRSNPDVSPAVDAIVLKALTKNPLNRYQSAAEMRADVLRAAAGRPVYAEPVLREPDPLGGTAVTRPVPGGRRPVPAGVGDPRRRRVSGWAIAALTALAVLAVVALVAGLIVSQQPERVTVPQVVGLTNEQADAALRARGLVPEPQSQPGLECGDPGEVIAQDPGADEQVAANSEVSYTFCVGPGEVVIPPLAELDRANAEDQLTRLGLKFEVKEEDSDKKKNSVISTQPDAGSRVKEGSTVILVISRGNLVKMPDLDNGNRSLEQARGILEDRGFTNIADTTQPVNDPDRNGKVVGQDPDPGALVKKGDRVTLIVGDYEEPPPTDSPTTPPAGP